MTARVRKYPEFIVVLGANKKSWSVCRLVTPGARPDYNTIAVCPSENAALRIREALENPRARRRTV